MRFQQRQWAGHGGTFGTGGTGREEAVLPGADLWKRQGYISCIFSRITSVWIFIIFNLLSLTAGSYLQIQSFFFFFPLAAKPTGVISRGSEELW